MICDQNAIPSYFGHFYVECVVVDLKKQLFFDTAKEM